MATAAIERVSAGDLARSVETGWQEFLLSDESRRRSVREQTHESGKRAYVYASAKRECTRRMVLEMTDEWAMPPWTPEQLANFRRGNDREANILADLMRIGRDAPIPFRVIGGQERFEIKDRRGRVVIVGKKDCEIEFETGERIPTELKSWNANLTSRIDTYEDLLRSPWTKPGAFQILSYLYGFTRPLGFMILDRHGIPKIIPVELEAHLDKMEQFLAQAEEVMDHAQAGTLPDFHKEAAECRRCWCYGRVCDPPLMSNGMLHVLADSELEAMLERREALKEAADEFGDLDKEVKTRVRGVESGIAGAFLIEGKEIPRKAYSVKESKSWQVKITKL